MTKHLSSKCPVFVYKGYRGKKRLPRKSPSYMFLNETDKEGYFLLLARAWDEDEEMAFFYSEEITPEDLAKDFKVFKEMTINEFIKAE